MLSKFYLILCDGVWSEGKINDTKSYNVKKQHVLLKNNDFIQSLNVLKIIEKHNDVLQSDVDA